MVVANSFDYGSGFKLLRYLGDLPDTTSSYCTNSIQFSIDPANGDAIISTKEGIKKATIKIVNNFGRTYFERKNVTRDVFRLDMDLLPEGTFNLLIIQNGTRLHTRLKKEAKD